MTCQTVTVTEQVFGKLETGPKDFPPKTSEQMRNPAILNIVYIVFAVPIQNKSLKIWIIGNNSVYKEN